uniref:Uncharacterized protein n=1 Tax=Heterorhabditis bacteriophora TaxID=37862 RepID=A0A1I7X5J3_HETBA
MHMGFAKIQVTIQELKSLLLIIFQ